MGNVYPDPNTGEWIGERETVLPDGEVTRETEWFQSEIHAKMFAGERVARWHIVLTDYGSINGQIEWESLTIADAQWQIGQAWGRWHRLPGTDGVVLLSDSLIARVYDATKDTDAPAYELIPHEKRDAIVRRRPRY